MIHAKRWYVYLNGNEKLVKSDYLVEVYGHDEKNVLLEVVDNHVVEEATDHDEIRLRGFDFNLFGKDKTMVG